MRAQLPILTSWNFITFFHAIALGAKPEEIKAKLTALRAAKERATQELAKARQGLRQIMNLRQEAVLVLNGLLD